MNRIHSTSHSNGVDSYSLHYRVPPATEIVDLEEKLKGQVSRWQSKLLDLGNRNFLINCSFNPTRGVVELVAPDAETVWRMLACESDSRSKVLNFPWRRFLVPPPKEFVADEESIVGGNGAEKKKEWNPPLSECLTSPKLGAGDLLTQLGDRALDRRLRTLDSHAHLSLSEQGVHCLYVAFGFLKWFESTDSEIEYYAPLMLVPASLSRDSADAPWGLVEAEDDAIENLCLRERLKQDFGLLLPPLPEIGELEEPGARLQFLNAVRTAIASNDRWEVQDRCALGRFAFPKIAMWQDLGEHVHSVLENPLCRSIGGDETIPPARSFGIGAPLPEAAKLDDEIAPGELKTILDCDSSQLEAILAARRGVSFVLDGPPGTGKSQTIANIIADALSEGRRVLFVSEKVSALDVVKRRLDDCGLGDFCLECHSSKANRKAVLDELRYCLDLPIEVYDDSRPKLDESRKKRRILNEYVRSLHRRRPPLDLSPFELYGHVSRSHRLGHAVKSRCSLPRIKDLNRSRFEEWLQLLDRAQESTSVIGNFDQHPWRCCLLTTRTLTLTDDLLHHLGTLSAASRTIEAALTPLAESHLLTDSPKLATIDSLIQSLRESLSAPDIPERWFLAPDKISTAILRHSDALEQISVHRQELAEFVEQVDDLFPDHVINSLFTSENSIERNLFPGAIPGSMRPKVALGLPSNGWMSHFESTPPSSVRQQFLFLEQPIHDLNQLVESIQSVSQLLAEVKSKIPLPIRDDLSLHKLPAVVRMAQVITEVVPVPPTWIAPVNWPRLQEASQAVLDHIARAAQIVDQLQGRLNASHIQPLNQILNSSDSWPTAWNAVCQFTPEGTGAELEALQRRLQYVETIVCQLEANAQEIVRQLGIDSQIPATFSLLRSFENVGPRLEGLKVLMGQWREPGVSARLRAACDAAISDLQEMTQLRDELEAQFSHRAFKPEAAGLAERAAGYQSPWKRWFGGFSKFRQEASDLYRVACPPTQDFLSSLLKLRKWHRRLADVQSTAESVAPLLPTEFSHDDLSAWESLQAAVVAFDQLKEAAPELVACLPSGSISFEPRSLLNLIETNIQLQKQLTLALDELGNRAAIDQHSSPSSLLAQVQLLHASTETCCEIFEASRQHYVIPPQGLMRVIDDGQLARSYSEIETAALQMCQHLADLLPEEIHWNDAGFWESAQRKLAGIRWLSQMVPSLDKYKAALSQPHQTDSSDLEVAASSLKAAGESATQQLHAVVRQLRLFDQYQPIEKLVRCSLNVLNEQSQSALQALSQRRGSLAQLLPVLHDSFDVEIEALPAVYETIQRVRACRHELDANRKILAKWEIVPATEVRAEERTAAIWLQQQGKLGTIPQLTRKVAANPGVRMEAQRVLDTCDECWGKELKESRAFLRVAFSSEHSTSYGERISQLPLGKLADYLTGLQSSIGSLDEWLKFSRWRRDMEAQGFGEVVTELLSGKYAPDEVKSVVAARYFREIFDQFAREDRLLGEFDLEEHEQLRERFCRLDEWEVRSASSRIRQYQLGRDDRPRSGRFTEGTSELGILQRELQKKRRQLPLRRLFAEIPSVLQRLKPCIMMSPLSVSTFLQSDQIRFDLVIFDEASQVFPWDAMGAIYRGNQLIVAGDEKQLPPTNFFSRADVELAEDEDTDIGDFESILSLCKSIGMPGRGLRWHYRSRREPLIAFSNRHFYSGDLVTFPSIRDATSDAVRLEFVPQGRWIDRVNLPEAERVADLVIRHLRNRPETSLGIIAFNQSQQSAIEDALYERRRKYPDVETLFHTGLTEPLFIKNLENVQGDERDVIILSMGYGYNDAGKFVKNFGPLTKSGGERRLNVAVTRAREEVILVASVKAADMDLSGSLSQGAHLLKGYLDYAERGVDTLARQMESITGEAESTLEQEVATALIGRGLHPVLQVGCGGFRIDMALKHPQRPGEFCLGIECDGATYHSSKTARDRDRIRQNVLEHLGWNIIRIWSTDWIRNPDRQIERVLAAYDRASTGMMATLETEISSIDDDLDDPIPRIEHISEPESPAFKSIKDVSDDHLRSLFLKIVKRCGATDLEGLIQQTSRSLGFARTGKHIRQRLETMLNDLLQTGHLRWVGERIASGAE
ncbi:DUF4011 domain-containing protein [Planctomicrobium sp. SH664]|uniref:DUF4011 domain-containing protein n=1 Tax=Planctomicrobium sp. SH664 TaxID=3448125 RepID=UPI003F5B7D0B